MYNTSTLNKDKKDIAFITPGIYDNVSLTKVRVGQGPTGNDFIEFTFNHGNKVATHTEWEPRKSEMDSEETYQKKCDNQLRRFLQILGCFYKDEELTFIGSSFKQLIDWVKQMLDAKVDKELLRVKFVYNFSGYTALPNYSVYTFIEPMHVVNEDKSVITKLNIDNFNKPVVADKEENNPNPEDLQQENKSDLPF